MEHREGYAPGWGRGAMSMMERRTTAERAGFVLPFLSGASRVIDVGCGPGTITAGLAAAAPSGRVLGVDREVSQVEIARRAAPALRNIAYAQGSAYALPVADAGTDVVFSHALLEHLADPAEALAEFSRVLRPGGVVAVCCSDWSGARLDPFDADVAQALAGHHLLRRRAGGDPYRGRVLPQLVADAGFVDVVALRVDRVDMAGPEFARWAGSRIEDALAGDGLDADDRESLRRAGSAARRWATRAGRFTQCWVEVIARRPPGEQAPPRGTRDAGGVAHPGTAADEADEADDVAGRTPFLTVDREVLDGNIAAMAAVAQRAGVALRPHAKTHKCAEIARRQLEAGAVGLSVATVAEAEVFADAGVDDLFVAYPLWVVGERARRLRALAERVALRVGVDSAAGAQALARATDGAPVQVVVEVDSGHHRTGVSPRDAAEVARAADGAGLTVAGVFTFPGHGYAPHAPGRAAEHEAEALRAAGAALDHVGLGAGLRSGGSTPTAELTGCGVTEIRPGVYVFGDAQQWELGTVDATRIALWVTATVVSARPGRVVLDAGSKVLGADRPEWATGYGRLLDRPGARITALSEHHATVVLDPDEEPVGLGDVVRVVPNHVCTAVNLADELHVRDTTGWVERWSVAARGANT